MLDELRTRTTKRVTKGRHYPLGATLTAERGNFAVYSKHAAEMFLLLFDAASCCWVDAPPSEPLRPNRPDTLVRCEYCDTISRVGWSPVPTRNCTANPTTSRKALAVRQTTTRQLAEQLPSRGTGGQYG